MSLTQIVPGVFVVSVPINDAAAFEQFFPAFKQTCLDTYDNSSCPSPATLLCNAAGRRSAFPEPPIPPPVTPAWMAVNDDSSSRILYNSSTKSQQQQPTALHASGELKSYTNCLPLQATLYRGDYSPQPPLKPAYPNPPKGRAILTDQDDGSGNYPPPIPEKPAYPDPRKGRAICNNELPEYLAASTPGCNGTPYTDPFFNPGHVGLRSSPNSPSLSKGLIHQFIDYKKDRPTVFQPSKGGREK